MAEKKPLIKNSIFERTDPTPILPQGKPGKTGRPKKEGSPDNNPLGIVLEPGEKEQLDKAAAALGVSRHQVLQYAVRQFLADWKKGKRPTVATKAVNVLKPD